MPLHENKQQQEFSIKSEAWQISSLLVTPPVCSSFLPKGIELTVSYVTGDTLFELRCCREQKYISSRSSSSLSERLLNAPNQSFAMNSFRNMGTWQGEQIRLFNGGYSHYWGLFRSTRRSLQELVTKKTKKKKSNADWW